MLQTLLLVFAFVLYAIVYCKNKYSKLQQVSRYPPGPMGLPIIGNIFQIGNRPEKKFMEISKTYGDIFSLRYGSYRVVVLNNYKGIRAALTNPAVSGRPNFGSTRIMNGISFNEGKSWQDQRRLLLKTLRDQGFGKSTTKTLQNKEISKLVDTITSMSGTPVDTKELFVLPALNAIWPMATGNKLIHGDPIIDVLFKEFTSTFEKPRGAIIRYFPILYNFWMRMSSCFQNAEKKKRIPTLAKTLFSDIIDKRQRSIEWNDTSRDLVDDFLKVIKSTTDPESHFFEERGKAALIQTLSDLLVAGGDTTAKTLHWMMLLLEKNPRVQEKMRQEVDLVLGDAIPLLGHKRMMPYTQCVILETLRVSSFFPLALYHRTTEDVNICGFDIPKDTIIIPNLYGAMHDPKVWPKPEEFRPERFLSEEGTTVLKPDAFLAFSAGKRICPGMSYALDALFRFAASIIQNFEIQTASSEENLSTEYFGSISLCPKPFKVKFISRKRNV